jgi:hypothetical protein
LKVRVSPPGNLTYDLVVFKRDDVAAAVLRQPHGVALVQPDGPLLLETIATCPSGPCLARLKAASELIEAT